MILTTRREIQVWQYLEANRKRLRAAVEARCRNDGRLLAAVYPLRDEFWAWHLGERYSPEQWRDEADGIAETLSPAEEPPPSRDGDASQSLSGPPLDTSSVRSFPAGMFQVRDPVGAYNSHTAEQILTAYPFGPSSSCVKCRSTYAICTLAVSYATGEYIVSRHQKPYVIYPARMSYCGDRGHDCGEHLTADRPWNFPGPQRRV